MFDFGLSVIKNISTFGVIYTRLMLKLESDEKNYIRNGEILKDLMTENRTKTAKPLQVHLLATWSSGSTFLTKLLTHYPGVFLSFEPLVLFSTYDALHDIKAGHARNTLKDIFQCNFTEKSWGRKYLNFLKSPTAGYKQFALHNLRLRSVCEGLAEDGSNKLCYDPGYVQSICSLHPINLVKTVRMRTRQIAPILDEADLNVKIIVLMRDPRAVRSSRNKIGWCNFEACNSAKVLCHHYEMDLEDALTLSRSHPENVIIVKYEELVTRPLDAIPIILKFLDLPWHPALTKFISDHMMVEVGDSKQGSKKYIHTQSEISSSIADKWKSNLPQEDLDKMMTFCEAAVSKHEELTMFL